MKIFYSLLLIRFFTPLVAITVALTVDNNTYIKEIPEYKEYERQANITSFHEPDKPVESLGEFVQAPLPHPFNYLTTPMLCKDKPTDGNIYGHIYCWGMILLFILLIGSLIFYQLRSIFWFKTNLKGINSNTNSNHHIELGSIPYGQRTN